MAADVCNSRVKFDLPPYESSESDSSCWSDAGDNSDLEEEEVTPKHFPVVSEPLVLHEPCPPDKKPGKPALKTSSESKNSESIALSQILGRTLDLPSAETILNTTINAKRSCRISKEDILRASLLGFDFVNANLDACLSFQVPPQIIQQAAEEGSQTGKSPKKRKVDPDKSQNSDVPKQNSEEVSDNSAKKNFPAEGAPLVQSQVSYDKEAAKLQVKIRALEHLNESSTVSASGASDSSETIVQNCGQSLHGTKINSFCEESSNNNNDSNTNNNNKINDVSDYPTSQNLFIAESNLTTGNQQLLLDIPVIANEQVLEDLKSTAASSVSNKENTLATVYSETIPDYVTKRELFFCTRSGQVQSENSEGDCSPSSAENVHLDSTRRFENTEHSSLTVSVDLNSFIKVHSEEDRSLDVLCSEVSHKSEDSSKAIVHTKDQPASVSPESVSNSPKTGDRTKISTATTKDTEENGEIRTAGKEHKILTRQSIVEQQSALTKDSQKTVISPSWVSEGTDRKCANVLIPEVRGEGDSRVEREGSLSLVSITERKTSAPGGTEPSKLRKRQKAYQAKRKRPGDKEKPTKTVESVNLHQSSEAEKQPNKNYKFLKITKMDTLHINCAGDPETLMPSQRDDIKEKDILIWIYNMIDEPARVDYEFFLKDGVILCRLMNRISPGCIAESEVTWEGTRSKQKNIAMFLDQVRKYGVPQEKLFYPEDLLHLRHIPRVTRCIYALAKQAQDDPKLGPDCPKLGDEPSFLKEIKKINIPGHRDTKDVLNQLTSAAEKTEVKKPTKHSLYQ